MFGVWTCGIVIGTDNLRIISIDLVDIGDRNLMVVGLVVSQ